MERGEGVYTVRSMDELVALLRQADTGLPIRDHKWHFRTYPNCTVGTLILPIPFYFFLFP